MSLDRRRRLPTGLWLSVLFCPYAFSGGYTHPWILAATPWIFATIDSLNLLAVWRIIGILAVFFLQWAIQWAALPSIDSAWRTILRSFRDLHNMPPKDWAIMSAHIATPLLLLGAVFSWIVYRNATSPLR
ncbi:MAG: hypothetical protein OWS74_08325, partial [Firmicutes bacterium]|nr:hypothetical protein [Bacillota bacterium]